VLSVEDRLLRTETSRAHLDSIEALNKKISGQVATTQRVVLTAFKRDKRKSMRWNSATSALSELTWAGLKAIPIWGGYCGLAYQIMQDPVKGLHALARTDPSGRYSTPWSSISRNGVMAPLSGTDSDYAYSGRISGFNDSGSLKAQQFEADIADLTDTSPLYNVSMGQDMSAASTTVKTDPELKGLAYLEWRASTLEFLSEFKGPTWTWYCVAQCVATMRSDHEGVDDLKNGVFNVGKPGEPRLAAGSADIKKLDKSKKISSSNSNLHKVLKRYTRPQYSTQKIDGVPVLSPATIYRVECAKALVVAYQGDARKVLAETISHHLFDIINNQAQGGSYSEFNDTAARSKRENARLKNKVLTLNPVAVPLRLVGAILPKKLYNYRTTFESKKWARFLSAVSVFYAVLEAYFDKQFVCDELPCVRSFTLFLLAFTDAYNTAMEYFCHASRITTSVRSDTAEVLSGTLDALLLIDPGINTFLTTFLSRNKKFSKGSGTTPGLRGFTHLKRITTRANTDRYDTKRSRNISVVLEIVNANLTAQQAYLDKHERGHTVTVPRPGKARVESSSLPSLAETVEDAYAASLEAVIRDTNVPASVQRHLYNIHRMLQQLKTPPTTD